MYYAQIKDSGEVVAVTETSSEIVSDNMVQIDFFDVNLLGKIYTVSGIFIDNDL